MKGIAGALRMNGLALALLLASCSTERELGAEDVLGRVGGDEFAVLLPRASDAVCSLQASAARTPRTLFAAICSPLPEPPKTTPSVFTPAAWSRATASAALMQKAG